ncbi:MAG: hypothetical protein M3P06_03670 [Acidobacteriota bacterium]|nr:hypothetical protein [Acidobacteriota bacterium]
MKTFRLIAILILSSVTLIADDKPAGLARLDFLIGKWRGPSSGQPGEGQVERECARILNDRFIECRSTVTYPPQKTNPKGGVHVERAIYSFDKRAKKLCLRQFHGEGFVNSYIEGEPLTFTTTDIENIPEGWRARETYKLLSADSLEETFELAEPGKEFARYSGSVVERMK